MKNFTLEYKAVRHLGDDEMTCKWGGDYECIEDAIDAIEEYEAQTYGTIVVAVREIEESEDE